jgi:hypothetical protein
MIVDREGLLSKSNIIKNNYQLTGFRIVFTSLEEALQGEWLGVTRKPQKVLS